MGTNLMGVNSIGKYWTFYNNFFKQWSDEFGVDVVNLIKLCGLAT
jgi:hypothetical protein